MIVCSSTEVPVSTGTINFSGMTPEQIAEVIAQRRAEYQVVVKEAKKAGVKVPKAGEDGPKTLVPVLSAAVRRTAAAHLRTRRAQQEEQAIQAIEQAVTQAYMEKEGIKALPREVRTELDAIRKDIGEVALPEWVDPQVVKRQKEQAKKAAAAATPEAPAEPATTEATSEESPIAAG